MLILEGFLPDFSTAETDEHGFFYKIPHLIKSAGKRVTKSWLDSVMKQHVNTGEREHFSPVIKQLFSGREVVDKDEALKAVSDFGSKNKPYEIDIHGGNSERTEKFFRYNLYPNEKRKEFSKHYRELSQKLSSRLDQIKDIHKNVFFLKSLDRPSSPGSRKMSRADRYDLIQFGKRHGLGIAPDHFQEVKDFYPGKSTYMAKYINDDAQHWENILKSKRPDLLELSNFYDNFLYLSDLHGQLTNNYKYSGKSNLLTKNYFKEHSDGFESIKKHLPYILPSYTALLDMVKGFREDFEKKNILKIGVNKKVKTLPAYSNFFAQDIDFNFNPKKTPFSQLGISTDLTNFQEHIARSNHPEIKSQVKLELNSDDGFLTTKMIGVKPYREIMHHFKHVPRMFDAKTNSPIYLHKDSDIIPNREYNNSAPEFNVITSDLTHGDEKNKTLYVHEIQSDLHQYGAKEKKKITPLADNWHKKGVEYAFNYAKKNGYTHVMFAPGSLQISNNEGSKNPEALGKFYDEKIVGYASKITKSSPEFKPGRVAGNRGGGDKEIHDFPVFSLKDYKPGSSYF